MVGLLRRHLLVVAVLTVLFTAGLGFVLRPLIWADQPAGPDRRSAVTGEQASDGESSSDASDSESSDGPGSETSDPGAGTPGEDSSPGLATDKDGNPTGSTRDRDAVRVGGATLTNRYHRSARRYCSQPLNRTDLPMRIVSFSVSPSQLSIQPCRSAASVFCTPGLELSPGEGCGYQVVAPNSTTADPVVTLVTEVSCTSRELTPCSRLPADVNPSPRHPIRAIFTQSLSPRVNVTAGSLRQGSESPDPNPTNGPPTEEPTTGSPPSSPDAGPS